MEKDLIWISFIHSFISTLRQKKTTLLFFCKLFFSKWKFQFWQGKHDIIKRLSLILKSSFQWGEIITIWLQQLCSVKRFQAKLHSQMFSKIEKRKVVLILLFLGIFKNISENRWTMQRVNAWYFFNSKKVKSVFYRGDHLPLAGGDHAPLEGKQLSQNFDCHLRKYYWQTTLAFQWEVHHYTSYSDNYFYNDHL